MNTVNKPCDVCEWDCAKQCEFKFNLNNDPRLSQIYKNVNGEVYIFDGLYWEKYDRKT